MCDLSLHEIVSISLSVLSHCSPQATATLLCQAMATTADAELFAESSKSSEESNSSSDEKSEREPEIERAQERTADSLSSSGSSTPQALPSHSNRARPAAISKQRQVLVNLSGKRKRKRCGPSAKLKKKSLHKCVQDHPGQHLAV